MRNCLADSEESCTFADRKQKNEYNMKQIKSWMLAAILSCGLVMTSCVDDTATPDNPVPAPEQPSAKDPGKWWIDENNMDKSVNPGDNFYMYCIGSWWKNTTIPEVENYVDVFSDMTSAFRKRIESITDPNFQTFVSHLKWADDGSEAAIAGQKLYDDVLAQSGLNEATTQEDVLRAFGRMAMMGINPPVWLEPFFIEGKVCFYADFYGKKSFVGAYEEYTEEEEDDDDDDDDWDQLSLMQMMKDAPSLKSHLVPLAGRGGTRAVPDDCLPLRYIVEGMGFDPKDVYFIDEYYNKKNLTGANYLSMAESAKGIINTTFSMALPVEELKEVVREYQWIDYGFICQKTRAEYNAKYAEEHVGKLFGDQKLSMNILKDKMGAYNLYMRAKLIADEMVPKGVKEDYKRYCEELRAVFAQRIKDNDWMSEGSKKNALEKLEAMVFNVGYPDQWIEEALPDFSKTKSLLEDIYSFRKARMNLLKAVAGKSRQEAAFTVYLMDKHNSLSIENAFHSLGYNTITIYPYFLMQPFYDPAQSMAINYAMTSTISHEITHGFDTKGSQYDKNGDYKEGGIWGSTADKAEYDRRSGLLINCFESLDVLPDEMPGVKAQGKTTLDENIADLGGIEIAWQAYLNRLQADGYTGAELKLMKQRFFLAYAYSMCAKYGKDHVDYYAFGKGHPWGPDSHSMKKERVNGIVLNTDGWYEAFDIKDGALYRQPADRIHIW